MLILRFSGKQELGVLGGVPVMHTKVSPNTRRE